MILFDKVRIIKGEEIYPIVLIHFKHRYITDLFLKVNLKSLQYDIRLKTRELCWQFISTFFFVPKLI